MQKSSRNLTNMRMCWRWSIVFSHRSCLWTQLLPKWMNSKITKIRPWNCSEKWHICEHKGSHPQIPLSSSTQNFRWYCRWSRVPYWKRAPGSLVFACGEAENWVIQRKDEYSIQAVWDLREFWGKSKVAAISFDYKKKEWIIRKTINSKQERKVKIKLKKRNSSKAKDNS